MNWDAIGAVGQVLGSVAVFITLAYLAVQTTHGKRDLQRSVNQSRADGMARLFLDLANNKRAAEASLAIAKNWGAGGAAPVIVATVERGGVTEADAWMMNLYQLASWQLRANTITYIDDMPDSVRASFDASLRFEYSPESWQRFWYESTKGGHNQTAVRYVDRLLAQTE